MMVMFVVTVSVAEPVLLGQSRSRCEGPDPGSGSTLDKTEEILIDILFVCFQIDLRLLKKQILKIKEFFLVRNPTDVEKNFLRMVESLLFIGAGAGQKQTGSATLVVVVMHRIIMLPEIRQAKYTRLIYIESYVIN